MRGNSYATWGRMTEDIDYTFRVTIEGQVEKIMKKYKMETRGFNAYSLSEEIAKKYYGKVHSLVKSLEKEYFSKLKERFPQYYKGSSF